jgi:hypothetical protein
MFVNVKTKSFSPRIKIGVFQNLLMIFIFKTYDRFRTSDYCPYETALALEILEKDLFKLIYE